MMYFPPIFRPPSPSRNGLHRSAGPFVEGSQGSAGGSRGPPRFPTFETAFRAREVSVATTKKTRPFAYGEKRLGTFAPGSSGPVRYSTCLKRLRAIPGNEADVAEFERDKEIAAVCVTHGKVADPVIGIVGDRVAFGCPWCSDLAILKAWEEEGEREGRS